MQPIRISVSCARAQEREREREREYGDLDIDTYTYNTWCVYVKCQSRLDVQWQLRGARSVGA